MLTTAGETCATNGVKSGKPVTNGVDEVAGGVTAIGSGVCVAVADSWAEQLLRNKRLLMNKPLRIAVFMRDDA
ncbi:hypothetical protein GCM10009007_03910 [Formosimonas limnophila]|uniref:Uncharacterized protein n=1 Tax=Formosimonas limnophila TaxID=1384487 RepID=A0A8J3FZW6_9BURK|nr:hypothetical protein GCM10009007_03910 [Formosimonas limnophila]